jgi:hypothetical protein
MIDGDDCGAVGGMNEWQEKPKYSQKTCHSIALSTTDPKRLEPGRHRGKPATSRLTYPTAWSLLTLAVSDGKHKTHLCRF